MPVPTTPANLDTTRRLLHDDVFDRILAKISDGSFAPGDKLDDSALAEWLGVSRFPIRQALSRLAALGVVDMAANRYTRVAQPDPRKFMAGVRILVSLWKLGAQTAVPSATDAQLAEFDADVRGAIERLEQFQRDGIAGGIADMHSVMKFFLVNSGNPLLPETAVRVREQVAHVFRSNAATFRPDIVVGVFRKIHAAVMARDLAATEAALDEVETVTSNFHSRLPAEGSTDNRA